MPARLRFLVPLLLLFSSFALAQSGDGLLGDFWQPIQSRPNDQPPRSSREQWLNLDEAGLSRHLSVLPRSGDEASLPLALPTADGQLDFFEIRRSHTMAAELADKYPELQTFQGTSADGLSRVRFELGPHGLTAMLFAPGAVSLIERAGAGGEYVSFVRERHDPAHGFVCAVHGEVADAEHLKSAHGHEQPSAAPKAIGPTLRTYRTAIAATGEYTGVFGGRVVDGLAGIVTTVNRINQIYETDLGLRLELIPNNDLIVYTNASTDPYTNNNGVTMLGQNISNLSTTIGNANFDFGHVFSTGGGGVAGLGVICGNSKARGVTGLGNPRNDPFWVDFVAHEMGHQLNGPHTFNGGTGNCSGGNRNGTTAYEIGSGSTIMAYAGICGGENLQSNSDPFFHVSSLDRIHTFTQSGLGSTCGTTSATGNQTPLVVATPGATIPARTPFALTASASDPDGDTLTYSWEQYDLGAQTNTTTVYQDNGSRPLFRAFDASPSPTRLFPRLENILSGTPSIGEVLPTTNRTLNFRVTVRDNREGGGGVQWSGASVAQTVLNVVDTGQAFALTSANSPTAWAAGSAQTVTWNVAGTDANGIDCASVDIDFSLDRGLSFPISLASGVDNDGSHDITVPDQATSAGRLRVACSDNLFFNINTADISVTGGNQPPVLNLAGGTVGYVSNGPAVLIDANAQISDADSADFDGGQLVATLSNNGEYNDRLSLRNQGDGAGEVGVGPGAEVRYGGVAVGSVSGGEGITPLIVAFNAAATPAIAQALLRSLQYGNFGADAAGTLPRTLRITVSDGDGGHSLPASRNISVQVNPSPILDARFSTDLASTITTANAPVVYTLSFSKPIDFSSVDLADFDNAGTSPITLSGLTQPSASSLRLTVTPTAVGTLTLRLPASADIRDSGGLPVPVPVQDLTTYTVEPPSPLIFSDGFEND
ncbi:MAG: zinc-dependent metalloprotease family protein [Lysobacteraceae bacterium]